MDRRSFLRNAAGLFVAVAAAPIVEPVRRFWQVGRNAPVGIHTYSYDVQPNGDWIMRVNPSVWADLNAELDKLRPFDEIQPAFRQFSRDEPNPLPGLPVRQVPCDPWFAKYDEPVRLVGEHGAVELPTDTLFGISAEPFDWGVSPVGGVTEARRYRL